MESEFCRGVRKLIKYRTAEVRFLSGVANVILSDGKVGGSEMLVQAKSLLREREISELELLSKLMNGEREIL